MEQHTGYADFIQAKYPRPTEPYSGILDGVRWTKYPDPDLSKGYTVITVDKDTMYFYGRLSNARAWNFITNRLAEGASAHNGELFTFAGRRR